MTTIETDERAVRVTIPRGDVKAEFLDTLFHWLRDESEAQATAPRRTLREVAAKSAMTPDDADQMADEAKARWWASNRHRFITDDRAGA